MGRTGRSGPPAAGRIGKGGGKEGWARGSGESEKEGGG